MFRTFQWLIGVTAVLVIAAVTYAIIDDKVANLLIGGAMVGCTLTGIAVLMEKRLGDAFDTGGISAVRAVIRELIAERIAQED